MICQLCGCDIGFPERLWLDDGGPLCGDCGQDVRATNVAINRERERRETMKGSVLLDGLDDLRDEAKTDDDKRSVMCCAIGAAAATLTEEQQESVLKCVRNCVRMYQQKGEGMSDNFTREIKITAAYDKRHKNPSKNYGIHGCNLYMYLHGPKATMNFTLYTNWHLSHVHQELVQKPAQKYCDGDVWHGLLDPLPADLGYHADEPQYENQPKMDCSLRPQGFCYYDGSTLDAEPVYEKLLTGGDEAVWKELEDYYNSRFSSTEGKT